MMRDMTTNEIMVTNEFLMRAGALAQQMQNQKRDIDKECGYPSAISVEDYKRAYDRDDIAERVVNLYPEECFAVDPEIFDSDVQEETEFEKRWKKLNLKHNLVGVLQRADELSGIGYYGVIFLGVKDGLDPSQPVKGVDPATGERKEDASNEEEVELLYAIPMDQTLCTIASFETDFKSPRYGLPTSYNIKITQVGEYTQGNEKPPSKDVKVHWTRIIHVADHRKSSNVFGKPRQRPVYNRLLDLHKLTGGSAEMFWKGAFPGFVFKLDPEYLAGLALTDAEKKKMREEYQAYSQSLQRYMAMVGGDVKSLAPQVADPSNHVNVQIMLIALTLGIPFRIFMGSEEGKLASSQDVRTWNRRLKRRQQRYLSPYLIRPFVDRLIAIGVLPPPKDDEYSVYWPDLDALSEQDKADLGDKRTTSLQKYVAGNVEQVIPPLEFYTIVLGMSLDEAQTIIDASEKHLVVLEEKMAKEQEEAFNQQMQLKQAGNGGGADNMVNGKPAGGQNPRNPAAPRSRSGSGSGSDK